MMAAFDPQSTFDCNHPQPALAREFAGSLATADDAARVAFGRATLGLLGHRNSTGHDLDLALAADPTLVAAHLLKGYGMKVLGRNDLRPAIAKILAQSEALLKQHGGHRERALADALEAWHQGRADRAAARLEAAQICEPDDLLLMKLIHAIRFMMGDTEGMLRSVERCLESLDNSSLGRAFAAGCLAFSLVESGRRNAARDAAELALERNPDDAWALHALAHVHYENGDLEAGAALLGSYRERLDGLNNFAGHIAWHEALVHLECRNPELALRLYDRRVATYPPQDYRDVSNASTLLLLLEDQKIDVDDRWLYLATIARSRFGDHGLAFADIHYVLALVGAGCVDEAADFVASMRSVATQRSDDFDAQVLSDVGAPVAEAIIRAKSGDFAAAAKTVRDLSSDLHRIGGSRAQRRVIPWVLRSAKNRDAKTLAARKGDR